MTDTKDTEAQTPAVRVKELAWEPWDFGYAKAQSAFGTYYVWGGFFRAPYATGGTAASDPKDAAQADFTARIMGALETTSMQGWQEKRIAELEAEVDDLKINVVAFAAPFMVQYAQAAGFPDGAILGHHYDILQKAGARMDSFIRYVPPLTHKD